MIDITNTPIFIQPVIDHVTQKHHGALVSFIGTVRDNAEGKRVLYLEYETYPDMARKKLEEICAEIGNRWHGDVDIVHRVGRIEVGDNAVIIVVGAAHRSEAFIACQYAIDRIKEIVPIWKKEYYEDGSSWIGHLPINTGT
jgi:molybdopterin synthase catalytic subunit